MFAGSVAETRLSPALRALIDQVWLPSPSASLPVAVSLGRPPPNHVVVETYAVVPNVRTARFLIPLGSRLAAFESLWRYHSARRPLRGAAEATLAAMFRTRVAELAFRDRLVVSIDRGIATDDYPVWLAVSHLAEKLGAGELFASIPVRPIQPNAKPVLELFDARGDAIGFAKLGWSEATKELVRCEADALVELRDGIEGLVIPELETRGTFAHCEYLVSSPLPRELRAYSTDPLDAPDVVLSVAHSAPLTTGPLAGSQYAACARQEMEAAEPVTPGEAKVLLQWLDRLERSPAELEFGRWHGDWTPYNLATLDRQVVAWDWEHTRTEIPLGLDALHWHHQLALPEVGLAAAAAKVVETSARLGAMGVSPPARKLTASLYLLAIYLRNVTLAARGGGWRSRMYPEMLTIAAEMDLD